jgi:hypothetical protein
LIRQSISEIFDAHSEIPRLILVDFDHTLLGGNSTELFIARSKPSALIRVLSLLLRNCIPWRLTRLRNWFRLRDYLFCRTLFFLLPRNIVRWKDLGPALFSQRRNMELETALARSPDVKIAIITFGMEAIVRPMLRGSPWENVELFSTPRRAPVSYFSGGKLEIAKQAFGAALLAKTMLITDSEDDLDLLMVVGYPVLIEPYGDTARGRQ